MPLPAAVETLLRETRSIAIVGASDRPERASEHVGRYLIAHGYDVVPVTPSHTQVYGRPACRSLDALPAAPDLVLCFRRSEEMPAIARAAVKCGARALWMQLGIVNEEAADLALAAGLQVVMDRCMEVDHRAWSAATVH